MEGSEIDEIERRRALSLLNSMSATIENVIQANHSTNEPERHDVREKYPSERNHEDQPIRVFRREPVEVRVFDRLGSKDESFVRGECGRSYDREVYYAGKRHAEPNDSDPELQNRHKRIDRYGRRHRSDGSDEFHSFGQNWNHNSSESYYDYRRNNSEHYDEELLRLQEEEAFVYPDLIGNEKKMIRVRIYDRSYHSKLIDKYKAEAFLFTLIEFVRNSKRRLKFLEFFDVRYEDGMFYIKTQTFRNYHWLCSAIQNEFACFNLRAELASGKKVTFTIPTRGRRLGSYQVRRIISRCSKYPIDFSQWFLKSTKTRGWKTFANYYVQNISEQKLRMLIGNFKLGDKIISVIISD